MGKPTNLDEIRIASPCPALWAEMKGDDRSRFCGACERHVYNLAAMTTAEATALIERTEGRLCVRLYRRRDGTILTADCPVGSRIAAFGRMRRFAIGAVTSFVVLLAGLLLKARGEGGETFPISPPPMGPGVTLADWKDWALLSLGLRPRPVSCVMGETVGKLAPPPFVGPPSPPAVPAPVGGVPEE